MEKNLSKTFKGRFQSIFYGMGVLGRKVLALNSLPVFGADRPSKTENMIV